MDKKENKTRESQIRATMNYDKRKGLVTISCKISKDHREEIEKHYLDQGYRSMNEYIISLISQDMSK